MIQLLLFVALAVVLFVVALWLRTGVAGFDGTAAILSLQEQIPEGTNGVFIQLLQDPMNADVLQEAIESLAAPKSSAKTSWRDTGGERIFDSSFKRKWSAGFQTRYSVWYWVCYAPALSACTVRLWRLCVVGLANHSEVSFTSRLHCVR